MFPLRVYSLRRGRHRRTSSPQRKPLPSPAIGAYRHTGVRANSGKLFWRLLMNPYRAACRRLREVWATQIPIGSIKPTENSATGSLPDIGSPAEAIGGGSREQSGFAKLPGWRRSWSSRSSRTGRPRFIRWPRALDTRTTDTSIRSIRNCVGQSAKRSRWRSKTEPDKMRRTLEDALHEHPAPTLSKLSGRLGYSSSNVLRAHEPDLCEQLSARHRSHVIERRADLERRAAAALSESPAPSLLDVCKRLGITVFFMNKYFPAVRQAIAEHYRQWAFVGDSATARKTVS